MRKWLDENDLWEAASLASKWRIAVSKADITYGDLNDSFTSKLVDTILPESVEGKLYAKLREQLRSQLKEAEQRKNEFETYISDRKTAVMVDLAPMVEVGGAAVTLAPNLPGMVGGYMLEQGTKRGLKWWGKGVGGTLLKGGAQLGKEAQDTVNDGKVPFGVGIAVGVAAVVALLYITRR